MFYLLEKIFIKFIYPSHNLPSISPPTCSPDSPSTTKSPKKRLTTSTLITAAKTTKNKTTNKTSIESKDHSSSANLTQSQTSSQLCKKTTQPMLTTGWLSHWTSTQPIPREHQRANWALEAKAIRNKSWSKSKSPNQLQNNTTKFTARKSFKNTK